jgi:hypothetical protein
MNRSIYVACSIFLVGAACALWSGNIGRAAPPRSTSPGSTPKAVPVASTKPAEAMPGPKALKPSTLDVPQPADLRHARNATGGDEDGAWLGSAPVALNDRELMLVLSTDEDFLPIPQSTELWNPIDGQKTCLVSAKIVARKRDGSEVCLRDEEIATLVGRKIRIKMEASAFPGEDSGSTETPPAAGNFDFSFSVVKPDVLQQDLVLETVPTGNGPALHAVEGKKDVNGNGVSDAGAVLFAHDTRAQARVTAFFKATRRTPVRIEYQRPVELQAPPGLWIPVPAF